MTTICCKCLKTKTDTGWMKAEQKSSARPSHGYCPVCHSEEIKKIMNYRQQIAVGG